MIMKFLKMMLPFVAVVGEYFTKTGRIGYDTTSNTVKYKTPSGVKEIATTDQVGGSGYFVGQLVESFSPTVPSGFLELNGQEVSKTTYAALYAFLGDRGTPSDPENFKLPDLAGRVTIGAGAGFVLVSEGGSDVIGLDNLPEIKPKLQVSPDFANTGQALLSFNTATGDSITSSINNVVELECITAIGGMNQPFLQPYIVVKKLIYAGV
jgi:microcystin-dependent protein